MKPLEIIATIFIFFILVTLIICYVILSARFEPIFNTGGIYAGERTNQTTTRIA